MLVKPSLILLVLIVAAAAASNLFDGDTTLTEEEKLVGIQIESDLSNRYEKHTFLLTANEMEVVFFGRLMLMHKRYTLQ